MNKFWNRKKNRFDSLPEKAFLNTRIALVSYTKLESVSFLILVPQPIYLGAEDIWVLTMMIIIGISFVGAV
jgi:hypothetical protein